MQAIGGYLSIGFDERKGVKLERRDTQMLKPETNFEITTLIQHIYFLQLLVYLDLDQQNFHLLKIFMDLNQNYKYCPGVNDKIVAGSTYSRAALNQTFRGRILYLREKKLVST